MHGLSARSNFIQANNRYRFDEIHLIKDEQPSIRIVDEQSSSRVEKCTVWRVGWYVLAHKWKSFSQVRTFDPCRNRRVLKGVNAPGRDPRRLKAENSVMLSHEYEYLMQVCTVAGRSYRYTDECAKAGSNGKLVGTACFQWPIARIIHYGTVNTPRLWSKSRLGLVLPANNRIDTRVKFYRSHPQ